MDARRADLPSEDEVGLAARSKAEQNWRGERVGRAKASADFGDLGRRERKAAENRRSAGGGSVMVLNTGRFLDAKPVGNRRSREAKPVQN
jgi:hypothetical protein